MHYYEIEVLKRVSSKEECSSVRIIVDISWISWAQVSINQKYSWIFQTDLNAIILQVSISAN
jgi:hypothetical protein